MQDYEDSIKQAQMELKFNKIIKDVFEEFKHATKKHGPYHTAHEGSSIIREEFEELWDEVKADGPTQKMRDEAIDLASSAIRFVFDICDKQQDKKKTRTD